MTIVDDTAWMDEALCAQIGGDVFHPENGEGFEEARAACALCPVRQQCLDYATEHDIRYGVWGGAPHRERAGRRKQADRAYRAAGATYAPRAVCGYCGTMVPLRTDGSYSRHTYRQEGQWWRCQLSGHLPPWEERTRQ